MNWLWEWLFVRDCELSVWLEEEDLGKEKVITVGNKEHTIVIPPRIRQPTIVRYRGIGDTKWGQTGDVYLHAWLNKGEDIQATLWLSQSCARRGADKKIMLDGKAVTLVVPPYSQDGQTIRLAGYGKAPGGKGSPPLPNPKHGHALIKLRTYPDTITPRYGSFDELSTDDMALEGWVINRIEHVIQRLARSRFPERPLPADQIADAYNESGWRGVFRLLIHHLMLEEFAIWVSTSTSLEVPGRCSPTTRTTADGTVASGYKIEISELCLDDPFLVAAILAHELCHVLYAERLHQAPSPGTTQEEATLQVEHTVDLLVFMLKVGECQLRVARDQALTLGYFNQDVFERMQIIAQRRLARLAGN